MSGRSRLLSSLLVGLVALLPGLALPAGAAAQEDQGLVRQAFVQAFGAAPADSGAIVDVAGLPTAHAAIEAGKSAVSSPDEVGLRAEFTDRLGAVLGSGEAGNILETLLVILKESVSELSEDKKYWLNRLSQQNKMNEELSEYMKELSEAGQELGGRERAGRQSTAATVPVTVRTLDPVWLDNLGEPGARGAVCDPCLATRAATLNAEQIQREQESVLGVQRRLRTALEETAARQAEIELREEEVVRLMAEVLRRVDDDRDGLIRRLIATEAGRARRSTTASPGRSSNRAFDR